MPPPKPKENNKKPIPFKHHLDDSEMYKYCY